MNASSLLPLISVLTFALGSSWGQSPPKLEKALASVSLQPGETAYLLKVSPSFQSPLHFLQVKKRDSWTIQVERFAQRGEGSMVELSFAIQMAKTEMAKFDPERTAREWQDFVKDVKKTPFEAGLDGIWVELHTRMGDAKEVTASVVLARLPFGVRHEEITPGIDAFLSSMLERTGIFPRQPFGSAVGVKK
jgi:hypothetical protein